jgi:FHS family glucose/mannose:H+ symporter-like MFS transporter
MQIEALDRMRQVRWLHLGIALTGVGTTLLGCILPTLSTIWHMNDSRAGILFAAQFSGSAFGALLVRNDFFGSLMRGYLLLIASAVSLSLFTGLFQVILFLGFGLGLGLTMTATSLLIGSISSGKRGAALALLNASWAVGAVLCPAIASVWISRWPPTYLFPVLAVAFAVTALLLGKQRAAFSVGDSNPPKIKGEQRQFRLLLIFATLAFLYVGVEVSVSGWMMTYVHRMRISSNLWPPIATSGFWIALLCGRVLAPAVLQQLSEGQLFTSSLTIAFTSTLLLLLSHSPMAIVFFAALAGLALGPIFPLCLARVLYITSDSPKAKWVFAISGLGGSLFPWMTGQISAYNASLRAGLLVPVFALGAMIILSGLELTGQASIAGSGQAADTSGA